MSGPPADYVDVNERIRMFYERYPEGTLQSWAHPELFHVGDKTYVAYGAAAFRHPEDPRPGVGWAWEPVPGPTPFTKDSELQNAETSAWGRAIVALGFETKQLASANEVRNRQESSQFNPPASQKKAKPGTLKMLAETVAALQQGFPSPDPAHKYSNDVKADIKELGKTKSDELTEEEAQTLVLKYEKRLVDLQNEAKVPF